MGVYATKAELVAEGAPDGDARNDHVLELASRYIDLVTGQWFEKRALTLTLDGNGRRTLHLLVPVIDVTEIRMDDVALLADDYVVYNRTYPDDRRNPKIKFEAATTRDEQNLEIDGDFGFVDDPGAGNTIPVQIKKVCLMLALGEVGLLSDTDRRDAVTRGRVTKEVTDRHSYSLGDVAASGGATGNPEIDDILSSFRRPMQLGTL